MSAPEQPSSKPAPKPARHSGAEVARTAVWVVLAVLIVVFAVLNVKSVKVDWIFGSSSAPLIVVIVVSLLVGVMLTHITRVLLARIAERRLRKH